MLRLINFFAIGFITILNNCDTIETEKAEQSSLIYDWQSNAQYSSDGEKIVFEGLYDSVYAVHFIDWNGDYLGYILGKENEFESHFLSSPTWGPNNDKITISVNGNLFLVNVKGDSLIQLTFSAQDFSPSWSKDGKYIAYTKSICDPECGIAIFNLSNKVYQVIGKYGGYPSWSKKSDKIYYYHNLYEKRPESHIGDYKGFVFKRIDVTTLKIDSLIFVPKTDSHLWLENCTISPDEKEILFAASEGAPPQIYIWKINLEHNSLHKITEGNHPSFNPNETTIVYTNTNMLEGGLWIMDRNGSNKRKLTKLNR